MKYVVRVMTMGDMSPAGLSHAYYNSPDGEPEDIVIDILGVYDTLEEAEENAAAYWAQFENEYGGEDAGGWLECIETDDYDEMFEEVFLT